MATDDAFGISHLPDANGGLNLGNGAMEATGSGFTGTW